MELKSFTGFSKVLKDIEEDKTFPVYLICGDDSYLITESGQKLIEAILPQKDRATNLEIVDSEQEEWSKIIQSFQTYPLFGSRRIIAVKDTKIFQSKFLVAEIIEKSMKRYENGDIQEAVRLFRMALGYLKVKEVDEEQAARWFDALDVEKDSKNRDWLNRMVEECLGRDLKPIPYQDDSDQLDKAIEKEEKGAGPRKSNVLILMTEFVDRRKRLYKTINEIGVVIDLSIQRTKRSPVDIEEEEKRTLLQQANELLKRSNKVLTKDGYETLLNKTGYNTGIFKNELEKLIISTREKQKIESGDVEEIVGRTKEDSIFDLQRAVGRRDFEKATFFLKELLGQGEFYLNLLLNIANELRNLISAKELISKELKGRWNPQMKEEVFTKEIYFPVILKMRREKEKEDNVKKSRLGILKLPSAVLMEVLRNSENFSHQELYQSIKLVANTDVKLKTTGIPPVHLLEKALMEICLNRRNKSAVARQ